MCDKFLWPKHGGIPEGRVEKGSWKETKEFIKDIKSKRSRYLAVMFKRKK